MNEDINNNKNKKVIKNATYLFCIRATFSEKYAVQFIFIEI